MARPETSFADYWDRHARERRRRPALADGRRSLTWSEAADLSRAIARGLRALGAEAGAVVACWLPNRVESYLLRIACERAGLVWLPIAARLREWELQRILERSEPGVLIVPDRFHGRDYVAAAQSLLGQSRKPPHLVVAGVEVPASATSLDEVVRVGSRISAPALREHPPEDALVILPTSGSTGVPKFAQFRVSTWLLRARAQAELLELREEDVVVALSQGIGPSIIPLFAAPIVGAAACLVDEFEPAQVIDMLARIRPTIVCGVPPQVTTLLDHPRWSNAGVERLRIWYTTGAAFPPAAAARVERRAPGIVLTGYTTPEDIANFYLEKGAKLVSVKAGVRGSSLFTASARYDSPIFPVQVVDTVGAGDGFAVGIISGMLEGLPLPACLERGNAMGALAVMAPGDQDGLPSREMLDRFLLMQKTGSSGSSAVS